MAYLMVLFSRYKDGLACLFPVKGNRSIVRHTTSRQHALRSELLTLAYRNNDSVRLRISGEKEAGRYITLSYRWGSEKPLASTSINFEHRTEAIPLPLPKPFRDAVLVTQALGVRYLWIDAVSIIQDSNNDWAEQAPRMAAIYGGAYCMIATDNTLNSNESLLEGSRRPMNEPRRIAFSCLGQEGMVFVRERCYVPCSPPHDWVIREIVWNGVSRPTTQTRSTYAVL